MTTLTPPAPSVPSVRVSLPTRKEVRDMLTDAVTARVLIVCATVVTVVLLLVLGFSATHGGDILVVSSAISALIGAITNTLVKFWPGRGGNSGS